ncbi:hypothetical protein C8J56DRAFT_927300, partial [Mycena floridula]
MESGAAARPKDCISCRIIGTATFATVGGYALYNSRAAATGGILQKRIMMGFGVGFLSAGLLRWL